MKVPLLVGLLALASPRSALADSGCDALIEVAPAYTAFGGVGLEGLIDCPNSRLVVGLVGVAGVTFPGFLDGFFWKRHDVDIDAVHWNLAVGAQLRWALASSPSKPYLELALAYERWRIELDTDSATYRNGLLVLGAGYLWRPFTEHEWFHVNAQLLVLTPHPGGHPWTDTSAWTCTQ